MVSAPRVIDWPTVRDAFVRRPERPTYGELAAEFAIPEERVRRAACDEGWPAARAAHLDAQLAKCDAQGAILAACRADRTVAANATSFAIVALERLVRCVESVSDGKAAQTQAQALNTAAFAFKNVMDGMRSAGLVGFAKVLGDEAKEDNGRWNPRMLQQINVVVDSLRAQQGAGGPVVQNPV